MGRYGEAVQDFLEAASRADSLTETGEFDVPYETDWAETARYLAAKLPRAPQCPRPWSPGRW
jgi:hypothetical protein